VENTEEHRRQLRELLFTTPGFENKISGVIMCGPRRCMALAPQKLLPVRFKVLNAGTLVYNNRYVETLFQKTAGKEGVLFPALLSQKGVVVGVKMDLGLVNIPFTEGETVTQVCEPQLRWKQSTLCVS
jgi:fructose-bisphosphate aldolase class I